MKDGPFFLQMTARVCGGVPSPLIEPIMGREGKGERDLSPLIQPKTQNTHRKQRFTKERASRMGSRKGKNPPESLKGRGK